VTDREKFLTSYEELGPGGLTNLEKSELSTLRLHRNLEHLCKTLGSINLILGKERQRNIPTAAEIIQGGTVNSE